MINYLSDDGKDLSQALRQFTEGKRAERAEIKKKFGVVYGLRTRSFEWTLIWTIGLGVVAYLFAPVLGFIIGGLQ